MTIANNLKKCKIFFTGGGTGGSVAPLLAIYEELKNDVSFEFSWVGTKDGIENEMLKNKNIKYLAIYAGKFRRYWSWQNCLDLFYIKIGFWQSLFLLIREKPNIIISAGSFVGVPLIWAGWLLRVPILIHQQDAQPGLANKIIALMATKITVALEKSLKDYGRKAVWVGNPIRSELIEIKINKQEALQKLGLAKDQPVVLVLGGGTGALAINELVKNNLAELTKFCQIVHITGKGKNSVTAENKNYCSFEFLDTFGLIKVFTTADIVVSRCGMSVLTELSYLGKPAILIPLPNSHQEANAVIFSEKKAAIVLQQNNLTNENFVQTVRSILNNRGLQAELSRNIQTIIKRGANQAIVKIIKDISIC
ncbi:MAG: undecaprenyldiphospho-muramoylpentapeptide beta-N-acetylglucosaminyltransferase [Candidatus Falkowbacteria bacterium]|nr:undecaprenyldiphospho-muramoylpentapeptide beta-N-acetylglucosaminyltransferase [Candidatus Falkowbacteria bacterium]